MTNIITPPDIAPRFHQPEHWQWGAFDGAKGGHLRYGYGLPEQDNLRGHVVILPGLSEFVEKYYETARDFMARGYGVWVIEWQGHGKSYRHLPETPQRRSSFGFEHDVSDLENFITSHIKPVTGDIPLYMQAHSMGGNIGLRALYDLPGTFNAATFSAPMLEIKAVARLPGFLSKTILNHYYTRKPHDYAWGSVDFDLQRITRTAGLFSADPERSKLYATWAEHDPELQVGGPTWAWIHHANESCKLMRKKEYLENISAPCLFATAGHDHLVGNKAIKRAASLIPDAALINLPEAHHEILMETDDIRDRYLDAMFAHFETH